MAKGSRKKIFFMNQLCFWAAAVNHVAMRFAIYFLVACRVWAVEVADPDPKRFIDYIGMFTEQDKANLPKKGGIVFTGSSSIRRWDLQKWFPKLKPLNRGFGGSQFSDCNHYLEETVLRYEPSIVVVFCGSNDVWKKKPPEQVMVDYREFRNRIFKRLPKCRLIILALKPSPKRLEIINTERRMNNILNADANKDKRITFLNEIFTSLLDKDGQPDPSLFAGDNLHLNDKGYARWAKILRPHLTH